jgi:hypothetical protein
MLRLPLYAAVLFLLAAALVWFEILPLYVAWLVLALGLLLFASGAWTLTKRR